MCQVQTMKVFFDPTPEHLYKDFPVPPTEEMIRLALAENNQKCPLNRIVVSQKNEGAMHILRLFAFAAMKSPNHCCRGMNFAIYSGPGQGKTHVVKAWAETIQIPFIQIQADALETTWQLFQEIQKVFAKEGYPLVPQSKEQHFLLPPCIIFFDEAHGLSKSLRTCGLLNAMEYNDGWLATMPPGKNQTAYMIDCQNVCWVAASTDPGLIFSQSEAFYTRLGTHIVWNPAGEKEVARIVKSNNPSISDEACKLVAFYQRVPRKAINFANQMKLERDMTPSLTWNEVGLKIAEINGIDQFGMHYQQLAVLKALGRRPIAKNNLVNNINCRIEELEKIIIPPLLSEENGGALIGVTSKGYAITRKGLLELEKRDLSHNGDGITMERIE